MEKLRSERGATALMVLYALCAADIAFFTGRLTAQIGEHADSRVEHIQTHNHELQQQLSTGRKVGNLILNDENHSFSFVSTNKEGQTENCKGKYEVKDNTAKAVGNLACTVTIPADR